MAFITSAIYSIPLVQCLCNGFKTIYLQNPFEIHQREMIPKASLCSSSWISAVKESWDETESVPFLSCYPTVMWPGMMLGCGRGRVWTPWGCGAAVLTDKVWQPLLLCWRSPLLRCLLSACAAVIIIIVLWAGRNEPPCAPVPPGQKSRGLPRVADEGRCVGRFVGFFAQNQLRWAPRAMATSSAGRDRPLARGWEQRNLWNHTLSWLWECKSKPWYKLNWCSFCVQPSPLILELPKALRDHCVR